MFEETQSKDVADLINNLYLEQTSELVNNFKKSMSLATTIDFQQVVSLLRSTVRMWGLLTSIQEDFLKLIGGSLGGGKQPQFVQKISDFIKQVEDFMDKQLQGWENKIDSIDISKLTPAMMDQVMRNLSELHQFYASAVGNSQSMLFMSVDSLLYPLRPFANLAKRLKEGSSTSHGVAFGFRLYCKIFAIAKNTLIARSAAKFIERLTQYLKETSEKLIALGSTKLSDMLAKQKVDLKRDIFKLAFELTSTNPVFFVFSSLSLVTDSELRKAFLETFFSQLLQVGRKMIPGDDQSLSACLEEARPTIYEFLTVNST